MRMVVLGFFFLVVSCAAEEPTPREAAVANYCDEFHSTEPLCVASGCQSRMTFEECVAVCEGVMLASACTIEEIDEATRCARLYRAQCGTIGECPGYLAGHPPCAE